jgi:hypothetical protein
LLDHQDLVEIYQNLFRRRPRSFQCDKNSHFVPRSARSLRCCVWPPA